VLETGLEGSEPSLHSAVLAVWIAVFELHRCRPVASEEQRYPDRERNLAHGTHHATLAATPSTSSSRSSRRRTMRSGSLPSNCFTVAMSRFSLPPNDRRMSSQRLPRHDPRTRTSCAGCSRWLGDHTPCLFRHLRFAWIVPPRSQPQVKIAPTVLGKEPAAMGAEVHPPPG